MRSSLKNIEFIEDYLLGNFDPVEHANAKERIDNSAELTHLFETQQCLYSATRRKALRSEIQAYAPAASPHFFKKYRNWFMGGLALIAGIIGLLIFNQASISESVSQQKTSPLSLIEDDKNSVEDIQPWIPFDEQMFSFNAEKETTIVGDQGTLILLAKNSLIDAKGKRVKGKVEAKLIEALDWEDMIAYNLTTLSDGKALSSGGMMRIRFEQKGKEVFVDPERPMHIEIPTDDYNAEMNVWEGIVVNDELDWKNPQNIDRHLSIVDLNYLDFIPTGFDSEVSEILPYKNHLRLTDHLVDSLYYSISAQQNKFESDGEDISSFAQDCFFHIPRREDRHGHPIDQAKPLLKGTNSVTGQIVDPKGNPIAGMSVTLRMDRYLEHEEEIFTDENGNFTFSKFYPGKVSIYASLHSSDKSDILWKYCLESSFTCPKSPKNYTLKAPLVAEYSSKVNVDQLSVIPQTGGCFIDPLTIKTLKSSRFQNTFIATREFEERLQAMHLLKNGSLILENYIQNVSKPMWRCDEMAANLLTGKDKQIFLDFASQRLTNVQNEGIHQEALYAYFSDQRRASRKENRKRLEESRSASVKEILAMTQSIEATLGSPDKLASLNAASKKRIPQNSDIEIRTSNRKNRVSNGMSYSFEWSSNNWCNIDRFLDEMGDNPWLTSVSTNEHEKDVRVYQSIREYQTVLELSKMNDHYQAALSKQYETENVYCMAMCLDDEQLYYVGVQYDPQTTSDLALNLAPLTQDEFYLELCNLAPSVSYLADRLRKDQRTLQSRAKVKASLSSFHKMLDRTENSFSKEIILYNRLFDALNRCNERNESVSSI